jgi:hypothetical protein
MRQGCGSRVQGSRERGVKGDGGKEREMGRGGEVADQLGQASSREIAGTQIIQLRRFLSRVRGWVGRDVTVPASWDQRDHTQPQPAPTQPSHLKLQPWDHRLGRVQPLEDVLVNAKCTHCTVLYHTRNNDFNFNCSQDDSSTSHDDGRVSRGGVRRWRSVQGRVECGRQGRPPTNPTYPHTLPPTLDSTFRFRRTSSDTRHRPLSLSLSRTERHASRVLLLVGWLGPQQVPSSTFLLEFTAWRVSSPHQHQHARARSLSLLHC